MEYKPKGVCAQNIEFDVEDGKIKNIRFTGGCNGNLQGISKLAEGMKVEEVAERLKGVKCGAKGTSCPDQLAKAVEEYIKERA